MTGDVHGALDRVYKITAISTIVVIGLFLAGLVAWKIRPMPEQIKTLDPDSSGLVWNGSVTCWRENGVNVWCGDAGTPFLDWRSSKITFLDRSADSTYVTYDSDSSGFKMPDPVAIYIVGGAAPALSICAKRGSLDCQQPDAGSLKGSIFIPFGSALYEGPDGGFLAVPP